jgi:hypothetical protein
MEVVKYVGREQSVDVLNATWFRTAAQVSSIQGLVSGLWFIVLTQISDCQKAHWKVHKPMCIELKGAVWLPVEITLTPTDAKGKRIYMWTQDRKQALMNSSFDYTQPDGSAPPNIYGDTPFIVKIQRMVGPSPLEIRQGAKTGSGIMLIYDRQRSFKVYLAEAQDPVAYMKTIEVMSSFSLRVIKIYFWAKRTKDWELSVCFDRIPDPMPEW